MAWITQIAPVAAVLMVMIITVGLVSMQWIAAKSGRPLEIGLKRIDFPAGHDRLRPRRTRRTRPNARGSTSQRHRDDSL